MDDADAIERLRGLLADAGTRFIVDSRCDRFREPALAEALAVWREKANGNSAPRRSDMTPQAMRNFVKRVALFEAVPTECGTRYRARITGQEFTFAYADMTGKFIDEVVPPKYLVRWMAAVEAVQAHMGPFRMIGVPEAFDRDHSVLEMLLAPLLDDDDKPNFVLFVGNFERGRAWVDVEADEAAICK